MARTRCTMSWRDRAERGSAEAVEGSTAGGTCPQPRLSEFTEGRFPRAAAARGGILRTEKWHVTGAGWIGQAIYGVNDGLGAAFGVVSGVAGATNVNGKFVLLSGMATAIASALSMGSGAYLATKSEREVYEAEIKRERMEIEQDPDQEREEMELFYQLKGFPPRKRR